MENTPQHPDTINLDGKCILQVIPTLETGGAERTCVDMARAIVKAGGKALVASAGGRLVQTIEEEGGLHIPLPLDAKFRLDHFWSNRNKLIRLCQKHDVDLIHARSRAPAFPAILAARHLKIPFLTTYHGIYSEKTALKRWYNSVMVAGDAVIANSTYTRDLILSRYDVPADKVHIIHRGTDLDLFDPATVCENEQISLRQKWRVPNDRPVVMLMARLTDWKGHFLAVEAARKIMTKTGTCPHFIFAGRAQSETYAARIRSAIVEASLHEHFSLVGHVDQVPLALSLADLVIVPSTKPEAFGRSVTEAAAMMLPVVAFDHGGAVETIAAPPDVDEEERTGFRVPVGDHGALADAIMAITALSKNDRIAMGRRGRAHISQHFSQRKMIGKTLTVYGRLTR